MQRSNHSIFDHEVEAQADLTEEFWGSAQWGSGGDRPSRRLARVEDTETLRALRAGVAAFRPRRVEVRDPTGEVRRTRSHGVHHPVAETVMQRRASASIAELAAGRFDETRVPPETDMTLDTDHVERSDHRPRTDVALTPSRSVTERFGLGGADPLLVRLGVLVLVGILLVPLALALRPPSDAPDTVRIESPREPPTLGAGDAPVDQVGGGTGAAPAVGASSGDDALPASDATTESMSTDASSSDAPSTGTATTDAVAGTPDTTGASLGANSSDAIVEGNAQTESELVQVAQSATVGLDEPATVDAAAERIVPECPQTYEAATGDSWYRIADAAGVAPAALMTENRATVDTVILAGDEICLPSGATVPNPPPTTIAPAEEPDTSNAQPATTQPATKAAAPPSGSPGRDASVDEVKSVIRNFFPESEWETAFTIVQRESRFEPTAYNGWCCYGLFQIYWNVHRGWLDDFGIDSAGDLFDPLLNVRAAHAIWQRSGNSWAAWSTYDG